MNKIKLKKTIQKISLLSLSLLTIFTIYLGFINKTVLAADPKQAACEALKKIDGSTVDCSKPDAVSADAQTKVSSIIDSVISVLSILVGAVSVIMLIVGGFKYVTSNGDSASVKSAKDTIMYALIGLLLVGFAQTIVRFVWSKA